MSSSLERVAGGIREREVARMNKAIGGSSFMESLPYSSQEDLRDFLKRLRGKNLPGPIFMTEVNAILTLFRNATMGAEGKRKADNDMSSIARQILLEAEEKLDQSLKKRKDVN